MDERDEQDRDDGRVDAGGAPDENDAEQADPESAPASEPPPGQGPGDDKQHDL